MKPEPETPVDSTPPADSAKFLDDVNGTSVEAAIRLGCGPMQKWFDRENDGLPFFRNTMCGVRPGIDGPIDVPLGNAHHPSYSLSHVPGRWLDALLNAEDTLGIAVDPRAEATLRHWLLASMRQGMGLPACMNLATYEIIPVSDLHNLREVMHGLAALCAFRNDEECERVAESLISVVARFLDYDSGEWDEAGFNRDMRGWTFHSPPEVVERHGWGRARHVPGTAFPQTFGRYLGALMRYQRATGSEAALRQARGLRNHMMSVTFADPTRYDAALHGDHTHSVTSALSGLARYAAATGDQEVFDRLEACFDGLLTDIATDFGWCTENYWRKDDYGEINNTLDMVETLLLMGQAGRTGCYQRAERMVRSHVLPSQLRDTSFIAGDIEPHLAEWSRGAFGFPCPYGLVQEKGGWVSYNWDIVGGGVSGLCDVWRHAVVIDAAREFATVNMPLDGTHGAVEIRSSTSDAETTLRIGVAAALSLRVRLPDWAGDIRVGGAGEARRSGGWLEVSRLQPGDTVEIGYDLVVTERTYQLKSGPLVARWTGDRITAMDMDFDPPLRFIPPSGV